MRRGGADPRLLSTDWNETAEEKNLQRKSLRAQAKKRNWVPGVFCCSFDLR